MDTALSLHDELGASLFAHLEYSIALLLLFQRGSTQARHTRAHGAEDSNEDGAESDGVCNRLRVAACDIAEIGAGAVAAGCADAGSAGGDYEASGDLTEG